MVQVRELHCEPPADALMLSELPEADQEVPEGTLTGVHWIDE
jgi:hypothetical protein